MFDYGRYTPYILTAYGIAALVLVSLILWSIWRVGRARRKLDTVEPSAVEKEKQS